MQSRGSQFTLLEATRIVARGSELDSKLDALCGHVLDSGASAAIVYLFDPVSQVLVPAAYAGIDPARFGGNGTVSADDPEELIARVVRERRIATGPGGSSHAIADA